MDRRLAVSCLYSVYLSLHSGQLFRVGSFKPRSNSVWRRHITNVHALVLAYIPLVPSYTSLLHISASPLRTCASGSAPFLANAAIYWG
jgi:hypothetical protein